MSETRKLFESYSRILLESTREDLLSDIKFVKSLLDKDMNDENYEDKTDGQLEIILNKYKKEFNNSGIDKFVISVILYNKNTNSAKVGYISNNDLSDTFKGATIFNSKEEAKDFLNNYKVPEGYSLENSEIYKIYFSK